MRSRWGENYESNLSKIKEAVAPVQGQRLVSEGEYIDATYYAISAGITESSAEIWGGQRSYLTNVASPGDVFASGYQTTAIFTPEDLKESLSAVNSGISFEGEPADWLGEAQRTAAGSVKRHHGLRYGGSGRQLPLRAAAALTKFYRQLC